MRNPFTFFFNVIGISIDVILCNVAMSGITGDEVELKLIFSLFGHSKSDYINVKHLEANCASPHYFEDFHFFSMLDNETCYY